MSDFLATVTTVTKAHGTGNDFVVVTDPEGSLELDASHVARLCDRHFGIGADGLLRVVRTESLALEEALPDEVVQADPMPEWFMDYRNADGSTAEMCGNGMRVFARFLVDRGLAPAGSHAIGTRGGVIGVEVPVSGDVRVAMGRATTPRARAMPVVTVDEGSWNASPWLMPNPHAVVFVQDLAEAGPLVEAPDVAPGDVFPDGVNVEFVVDRGDVGGVRTLDMRVFERGVGETLSCGTGVCAAAVAALHRDGPVVERSEVDVRVPGGTLRVEVDPELQVWLTGAAEIVADVVLLPEWWAKSGS